VRPGPTVRPWGAARRPRSRGLRGRRRRSGADGAPRPRRLDQLRDGLRRPGAVAHPMVHALEIDAQFLHLAGGDGIVEADTLDEAAARRAALVGDHDVVERALLRTAAGQPNGYHGLKIPRKLLPGEKTGGFYHRVSTISRPEPGVSAPADGRRRAVQNRIPGMPPRPICPIIRIICFLLPI